jgi:hypothetical protein
MTTQTDTKSYMVYCAECGQQAIETECMITATSITLCETCQQEYQREVEANRGD